MWAWSSGRIHGTRPLILDRIERQYGKARRIWLMDRGVPTEEVLSDDAVGLALEDPNFFKLPP
jgi:hypothetical protein